MLTKNGEKPRDEIRNCNPYELPGGGITGTGQMILEWLIHSLKEHALETHRKGHLDKIIRKIHNKEYLLINEVVRDLKYSTKVRKSGDDLDLHYRWFEHKLNPWLIEHFRAYNFDHIKGDLEESMGPPKKCMSSSD